MISDPQEIMASETFLKQVELISRRRFIEENERDEFFCHVIDALKGNDYRKLREFKGKSSFKTYCHILLNREAVNFIRAKYRRKRLPESIGKMGTWAREVYKLWCWKRVSLHEAYEMVRMKKLYKGSFESFLGDVDPVLKVRCPDDRPRFVSCNVEEITPIDETSQLERILEGLDRDLRRKVSKILKETTETFTQEEQLLARLVYGKGMSVSGAGRSLGLSKYKAFRVIGRVHEAYRAALKEGGITSVNI